MRLVNNFTKTIAKKSSEMVSGKSSGKKSGIHSGMKSGNITFLDNKKFKLIIKDIKETASALDVDSDIFKKNDEVVGTEAMMQLTKDLNALHEMSNSLKPHMLGDIVPLFSSIQSDFNKDDLQSSNGITFL